MKKMIQLIVTICILLLSLPVFAVKLPDLYQAEIPVATQAADERSTAVKQGLLEVLIKLSGDQQIEKNPVIKSALQKADYYVQEYQYASAPSLAQYIIQVRFNTNDLNQLLKRAGVNYWGETRPLILVWLALARNGQNAEIVSNGSSQNTQELLNKQARKFGLPLIFPMMDVADLSKITPDDINTVTLERLKEAGKRYAPDAYLVGTMEQTSVELESKWHLFLADQEWTWTITGKTMDTVIANVLNQVSTALAGRYVVKQVNTQPIWVKLEVSNISERNDLGELMRYLKQLSVVQKVQLSQVSGDVVEVAVLTRGTLSAFQQNAVLGQRLVLKSQDDANNKLIYEWTH